MAKLPKWPKQPKSNSPSAWAKYEERVKAVAAKRKTIQEMPKKKEAIKARVASLKAKH